MYNSFFGLTETPFNLTPDPRYLYLSANHREAIDHLLYGINERKGFILITGGIGAGKTTLCRELLDRMDRNTKSALILNSFISDTELLKLIVQEFGVELDASESTTRKDYVDALNSFLLETFSSGGNAVLIIDEAQNLSRDVLEQLRMLSNLETEREKLIQIVLIGQPELNDIIGSPSLRQLNDRIIVRYFLKPLENRDIKGYVEHRLVVAGGHGNIIFTGGAYKKLYSRSNGNPRRINSICDRALLIAYTNDTHTVTARIIEKATNDLYGLDTAGKGSYYAYARPLFMFLLVFFVFAAVSIAGFSNREIFLDLIDRPENTARKDVTPVTANKDATPVIEETPVTVKIAKKVPGLFMGEEQSIKQLFSLFYKYASAEKDEQNKGRLNLVSFQLAPEYYIMLKKPFRLKTAGENPDQEYLLITGVSEEGARCLDSEGNPREISKEFLFENWSGTVSWIYPVYNEDQVLKIGMKEPALTQIQKTLYEIGYMVAASGTYDMATFNELKSFQKDFGLQVDGSAGPRTRALLYQMAN
ncbi:MAG: AAA family ATPase [Deltaproteobacteria bacterium]|nr:AAA family ATPase [Deltaproteobacteria bacterium]